ncbi:hypothetical protein NVP1251O_29 [Vibrio phage 1.251.O._10N.261.55.E5]|nr:hypothetical protein NVP1251O_29 [Vibrio phage 1.251.O._10N.261.55.E5]
MVARATIGQYKVRAILVHGDCFYDYTNWPKEWKPAATKVETVCKEHGPFLQQMTVHARGQGCRKCNPKKISASNLKGAEYYLKKARRAHNDKYDYSLVPEKSGALSFVKIICPEHGEFTQRLERHSSGSGCGQCGIEATYTSREKRIDRCNHIHDYKYDYSLLPQKITAKTKVTVICPEHGEFVQVMNGHQGGQGCPTCNVGGFNVNAPGYLYMMRSRCGVHMKIGISKNPKKRLKDLKFSTPFELDMTVYKYFKDGGHARSLEKAFHSLCKSAGFRGFCGATEWFEYDPVVFEVVSSF